MHIIEYIYQVNIRANWLLLLFIYLVVHSSNMSISGLQTYYHDNFTNHIKMTGLNIGNQKVEQMEINKINKYIFYRLQNHFILYCW
jgi:hypothetical protein